MLDNAEKLMWKYLLLNGIVVEQKSFYGVIGDVEKSIYCREIVEEIGIDWDKTTGVRDDWDTEFNGTFDEPARVTFLEGHLVTKDGAKWHWYHEYNNPINILDLIKDIIPDPFEKQQPIMKNKKNANKT